MVKTKTITIDIQAHRILKNVKEIMLGEGRSSSLSAAVLELAMPQLNLCDTCTQDFGGCGGLPVFGTGRGDDNVYDCKSYVHKGAKL